MPCSRTVNTDLERVGSYVMCRGCRRVKSVRQLKLGDGGMETPLKPLGPYRGKRKQTGKAAEVVATRPEDGSKHGASA